MAPILRLVYTLGALLVSAFYAPMSKVRSRAALSASVDVVYLNFDSVLAAATLAAPYCIAIASSDAANVARNGGDSRLAFFIGAHPMNFFYGLATVTAVIAHVCMALAKPEWSE